MTPNWFYQSSTLPKWEEQIKLVKVSFDLYLTKGYMVPNRVIPYPILGISQLSRHYISLCNDIQCMHNHPFLETQSHTYDMLYLENIDNFHSINNLSYQSINNLKYLA